MDKHRIRPVTLAEFNALVAHRKETGALLHKVDHRWLEWVNDEQTRHRDGDLPAVVHDFGTCFWMQNGMFHRDGDRPATIYPDGSMYWFKNNARHRDDDQPAVMLASNGKVHTLIWYIHGDMRRSDGRLPVVVGPGHRLEWWEHGVRIGDQDDIPSGAVVPPEYEFVAKKSALKNA